MHPRPPRESCPATGVVHTLLSKRHPTQPCLRALLMFQTSRHAKQLRSVFHKRNAQAELNKVQSLETTYVKTGFFMDFWGIPVVKSYFDPLFLCVDILHEAAAIPGDGNTPVVMT